jgi:16S rRNA (cytidine1402-2'-O)-methyltransferase
MQQFLDLLQAGDAALLISPLSSGRPDDDSWYLVQAALERGFPVVPVPGPAPAVTALLLSGLPADSFLYLGWLPGDARERRALLNSVSGEPRTCIVLALPERLPAIFSDLLDLFGDRPLVALAFDKHPEDAWRGHTGEAIGYLLPRLAQSPYILIVGGAREEVALWQDDRVMSEIQACLERGLGAKETSQQLAAKSGWPRREIYRLAVEAGYSKDKE